MPRRGKNTVSALVAPETRLALWRANSPLSIVASPLGFQNTASPPPSSATALWPMPTSRAPTGNSRNSAPAFWVAAVGTVWAVSRTAGPPDNNARIATIRPSERLRLIDQHDGDVILHGVDQAARVAHQLLRRLGGGGTVLQRPFALGADEEVEQVGGEAPARAYPRRWSAGPSRRQRANTFTWRSKYTGWPTSASILVRAA